MRISTAILAAVLWANSSAAGAQGHRAEIMAEVVDPCWLYSIRLQDTATAAGVSERQTLELMKLMNPAAVNNAITAVEKIVRGKDRKSRTLIYKWSREQCISGVVEGTTSQ